MLEEGSNCYGQAAAELQRGAFPLGLPADGLPRSEAFSQLVHIKGIRVQRELYPRTNFNAALGIAAFHGLECYRFLCRSFLGMDYVPIALVPRGSNVVVAHVPSVFSRAADTVIALGHRLYFEVEGGLRSIREDEEDGDHDPAFCRPLRGSSSSNNSGACCSSSTNNQKPLTPPSLACTRRNSFAGASGCGSGSRISSSGSNAGKVTAWMPSSTGNGDGSGGTANDGGGCNIPDASLPNRWRSGGTSSASLFSAVTLWQSSSASTKSSASFSVRSLCSLLSSRHSNSSRTQLCSEPEIDLATDPRLISNCDDDHVTLMNGGRFPIDKLGVTISVYADGEEGAQAFRRELEQRGGFHSRELSTPAPADYRPMKASVK